MADEPIESVLALTADIVAAHVGNNNVQVGDVPALIRSVHAALSAANGSGADSQEDQQPSVSIRSSVKPDYIVCLEDGKKLKMLKGYLASNFGMTPAEYRAKWKLPADYPMVAPNYSIQRKELAHKMGLGRKKAPATSSATASTRGRGRPAAAIKLTA